MNAPQDITRRTALAMAAGAAVAAQATASESKATEGSQMEKVTGIGGFFFRAKDPKKLAQWYEDNFGVNVVPKDYDGAAWRTEAGTTVFAPFKEDTTYFGAMKNQWMINFRVRNLEAMAAQLRASGVKVDVDPEEYPNGRFAQLFDPEGNPIQLWQPGGKDPG